MELDLTSASEDFFPWSAACFLCINIHEVLCIGYWMWVCRGQDIIPCVHISKLTVGCCFFKTLISGVFVHTFRNLIIFLNTFGFCGCVYFWTDPSHWKDESLQQMSKMLQTKRHNQTVIMYIYKNIFMLAYIVSAPFMCYYTNNAMGKKTVLFSIC